VHPGEKIPVDGFVTEGVSAIDESMISGCRYPVAKEWVVCEAGTINQQVLLFYRLLVSVNLLIGSNCAEVQEAQGSKASSTAYCGKISFVFVPVVLDFLF
jgi:Cu2+-exporting ATPase